MAVFMSKKKVTDELVKYCDKCFAELSNDNVCNECEFVTDNHRKSIESVFPEYKKMFLPKDEGITWERVK